MILFFDRKGSNSLTKLLNALFFIKKLVLGHF
jgi:hypothetical protein